MLPLVLNATEPDINSLVQAEKDFSKLSVEKGIKDLFISYFADDSIIFVRHRLRERNGMKDVHRFKVYFHGSRY